VNEISNTSSSRIASGSIIATGLIFKFFLLTAGPAFTILTSSNGCALSRSYFGESALGTAEVSFSSVKIFSSAFAASASSCACYSLSFKASASAISRSDSLAIASAASLSASTVAAMASSTKRCLLVAAFASFSF